MIQRKKSPRHSQEQLIIQQTAEGYWKLTNELATCIGTSLDKLSNSIPSSLSDQPLKNNIWATSLALECLKSRFNETADQWELLAKKGSSWITSNSQMSSKQSADLSDTTRQFLKSLS